MSVIAVTPIYAAIIALLMAALSTRVGFLRGKVDVALGHGDNAGLHLAIRRFGNLSEYAAVLLLLLFLLELRGTPPFWLHVFGVSIVVLRLIHPLVLFDTMDAPMWKKAGRGLVAGGTALLLVGGATALLLD